MDFPAGFSTAHQQSRIRCISEVEEIVVVGEVTYTVCRDSLTVTPRAGGEATELARHRSTIYRKQPDGRWLLARDATRCPRWRAELVERPLLSAIAIGCFWRSVAVTSGGYPTFAVR